MNYTHQTCYVIMIFATLSLTAAPGCLINTRNLKLQEKGATVLDLKKLHQVAQDGKPCLCPCGSLGGAIPRKILDNGLCTKCRHFHYSNFH